MQQVQIGAELLCKGAKVCFEGEGQLKHERQLNGLCNDCPCPCPCP